MCWHLALGTVSLAAYQFSLNMHFLPLWPPQVSVEKVRSSELTVWHQANAVLLLCNSKIKVIRESMTPKFVSSIHTEATLWCTALFSLTSELLILLWDGHKTHNHTLSTPSSCSSSLVSREQGTQAISLPASTSPPHRSCSRTRLMPRSSLPRGGTLPLESL